MKLELKSGTIHTVAGTGEPGWSGESGAAASADLNEPKGVAVDGAGHLFIADSENHVIRRVDRGTGRISRVAGHPPITETRSEVVVAMPSACEREDDPLADAGANPSNAFAQQTDLSGTVRYIVNGSAVAKRFEGDGGPAVNALLNFPSAVVVDQAGHLYIADTMNHRVRRVDATTGVITTLAGIGAPRFSGDGGPANEAGLNEPSALAVNEAGLLYIADQSNNRVRTVDLMTGRIQTIAGTGTAAFSGDGMLATESSLAGPSGLALGSDGTLYIADTFNGRIRGLDPITGLISTVVGDGGEYRYQGPEEPHSPSLSRPSGLAADAAGNLYIADSDNHLIRRWDKKSRTLARLAGVGQATFGGDGGSALEAGVSYPFGLAVDRTGRLLVADTFNHRIREIVL
jgi:sugar lactone lactonase YvrE